MKLFEFVVRPIVWIAFKLGFIKSKRGDEECVVEIKLSIDSEKIEELLNSEGQSFESDFDKIREKDTLRSFYDSVIFQLVGLSKSGQTIIWHEKTSLFSSGIEIYWPIKSSRKDQSEYEIYAASHNGLLYVYVECDKLKAEDSRKLIFVAPIEQAMLIYKTGWFARDAKFSSCKIERNIKLDEHRFVNQLTFFEGEEGSSPMKIVEREEFGCCISYYNEFGRLSIYSTLGSMQYPA